MAAIKREKMKCNTCGLKFNPANLSEVANHEHTGITFKEEYKGKKVINHPREIYPYCSADFGIGVRMYLSGDSFPVWPEPSEVREGYICAERDNVSDLVVLS